MKFSSYERFVILVLAFLQFTVILDFMIMAPMGAILMPKLHIEPSQFSLAVSVYAFGAGASGILVSGFADRFDRKRFLLFFYAGFLVGTLLCGIAPSYEFLIGARLVTGIFSGVVGSIVMAIVTDLFPFATRGRVMGIIQASFSASQILGLPLGLYLANNFNWHFPFLLIGAVGILVGVWMALKLKPIDEHLKNRVDRHPLHHMFVIFGNPTYLFVLVATCLLAVGGFMLMPFASAFSVHNLGISLDDLPTLYLIVGAVTFFSGPIVGRATDRFGKLPVFTVGSVLTSIVVITYTHMEITPLPIVALIASLLFFGIFSRMIPAMALISAIPSADNRGGFMAVSGALQQFVGGVGAFVAGHIVTQDLKGHIYHYPELGYILVGTSLVTLIQMIIINRKVMTQLKAAHETPVPAELK